MLEIVDIRDATEEEIKEYTRKQESPEWQPAMIVGGADCNKWTGKQQHNF